MSTKKTKGLGREDRAESTRHLAQPKSSTTRMYCKLDIEEIRDTLEEYYPPILSLEQAAELAGWASGTLKRKVSEGYFRSSVSRRRPLRFWRDKFVQEVMK